MWRLNSLGIIALALSVPGWADGSKEVVDALGPPDSVEVRVGTREFREGVPNAPSLLAPRG